MDRHECVECGRIVVRGAHISCGTCPACMHPSCLDAHYAFHSGKPTFSKQCMALLTQDFVILGGRLCQITDLFTPTATDIHIAALDLVTRKKIDYVFPSCSLMEVPVIRQKLYKIMDISDGFANLMDPESSDTKVALKLPEGDLGQQIQEAFGKDEGDIMLTVIAACGEEAILEYKNMPKDN